MQNLEYSNGIEKKLDQKTFDAWLYEYANKPMLKNS